MKGLLAALLHCVIATTVAAQHSGVFASIGLGAAKADTISGVVLNATLTARTQWFLMALTPVEFITYSGGRAPYITSDIAGEDVCRNSINGQQAGRQRCVGTTALFGATGSLAVRVASTPAFVGFGTRMSSNGIAGFGTLAVTVGKPLSIPWTATAQVGGQYISAVVSVGTRLNRRRR